MTTSSQTRVAVLVGSLRADSLNRRIAEHLSANAPEGVTVDIVEGLDRVPFYNEEIDGDTAPASAVALREAVSAADRVLVVTPEYNGTMPAVLNNAIDWLSRPARRRCDRRQAVRGRRRDPHALRRQVVARARAPLGDHRRCAGRRGHRGERARRQR
ncbi:NADPH-dependent FMN reductase [Nocardioides sp. B-3]|uniref:NADPH-dependent FMN reductase n=1 Tax=Nocardioides sp. B-3 TaxID=2895565 RepID=UPI002152D569|nr:NADPH-dependent FMN reductase [Nocardioides sp. B-3]UUZ59949.1 NAD(P)H-dependent oxidoreductase [Nocardioides sp. B-3]